MELQVTDIDDVYLKIRKYLVHLSKEFDYEWTPEYVRDRCKNGDSTLFYSDKAFIVVEPQWTNGKGELLVWIMHSFGKEPVADKYADELAQIARDFGMHRMVMLSKRKGFERLGWNPSMIYYTKDVADGQEAKKSSAK